METHSINPYVAPALVVAAQETSGIIPTQYGAARIRRYFAAESVDMATVRTQLAEAEQKCLNLSTELRSVAIQAQERERWWRGGVGALEVETRRAVEERNQLLLIAEQNWTERHESMMEAESNAQRQAQQHPHLLRRHAAISREAERALRRAADMEQSSAYTLTHEVEPATYNVHVAEERQRRAEADLEA